MDSLFIKKALEARHPLNEGWLYLTELRTRRGYSKVYQPSKRQAKHADFSPVTPGSFDAERYIDAFAMRLYPSTGFHRVAYEIKVSREDWLQELTDPCKRAQAFFLSHQFWFVVGPGVYDPMKDRIERLGGCGLLEIGEDGSTTEHWRATKREAWPMPETFIVSLLYTAQRSSVAYAKAIAELDHAAEITVPHFAVKPVDPVFAGLWEGGAE